MPDKSYRLFNDSVPAAIGESKMSLLRFINSDKFSEFSQFKYRDPRIAHFGEIIPEGGTDYIKVIPTNVATLYWLNRAFNGNKIAQAIMQYCAIESIERRADFAFNNKRSELEYNRRFQEKIEEILADNREEIFSRRLPGDDLYLPLGIN